MTPDQLWEAREKSSPATTAAGVAALRAACEAFGGDDPPLSEQPEVRCPACGGVINTRGHYARCENSLCGWHINTEETSMPKPTVQCPTCDGSGRVDPLPAGSDAMPDDEGGEAFQFREFDPARLAAPAATATAGDEAMQDELEWLKAERDEARVQRDAAEARVKVLEEALRKCQEAAGSGTWQDGCCAVVTIARAALAPPAP